MNKLKIKQANEKYHNRLKQEMVLLTDTYSTHILEFVMYGSQATANWIRKFGRKDLSNNPPEYLSYYFKREELDFVESLRDK